MQIGYKSYSVYTSVFLIDLWKVGISWISRKRGILGKGGGWSRKGGYDPLTNYDLLRHTDKGEMANIIFPKIIETNI